MLSKTEGLPPLSFLFLRLRPSSFRTTATGTTLSLDHPYLPRVLSNASDSSQNSAQAASIRRGTHTDIWPWLSLAWRDLVAAEVVEQGEDGDLLPLATALSRFSRNIVAEVPENQAKML